MGQPSKRTEEKLMVSADNIFPNHSSPWDRTLPRPAQLLSEAMRDTFPRHDPALLQHHIAPKDKPSEGSADPGYFRRSTIANIPPLQPSQSNSQHLRSHSTAGHALSSDVLQYSDRSSRKRQASVMSVDTNSPSLSPSSTGPGDPSQFCLCQPEPKIPRPRNAFILYRQHQHAGTVAQHPGLPNPDISKIIGEQWRLMSDKAKKEWKALAEEEKFRHSQQYPDYRYKPKRNSRVSSQSSNSGPPSQNQTEGHTPCQKCGGKVMNAPLTPFPPFPQGNGNLPAMTGIPPPRHQPFTVATAQYSRMPGSQQTASPPHTARARQYAEVFAQQPSVRHNPRVQYTPLQQKNDHVMVSPDAKRRRFNNSVFVQGRPAYHEPQYPYAPHDMGPPPRNMLVPAQPQLQEMPARTQQVVAPSTIPPKPQSHGQSDASLTLPPLQTPVARPRPASPSTGAQSQKSGIEAMIKSIPVLNKLKILSQIAPQLADPGPTSPPQETRGAILAVEGMDRASVMNMTATLAEQLEKESKFAVRIFEGPNSYGPADAGSRSDRASDDYNLTSLEFLNVISEWHKISREMVDYITHKPGRKLSQQINLDTDDDLITPRPNGSSERPKGVLSLDFVMKSPHSRPLTPPSAISPKTMLQASELSLRSPPSEGTTTQGKEKEEPRRPSRIPAAALAMRAEAKLQAELEAQAKAKAAEAEASAIAHAQTEEDVPVVPAESSAAGDQPPMSRDIPPTATAIPIAIVPHYQLTTVDASAVAMPITDAYSPHSHWQWLATIWRGCVGPDVTIVIKGPNDEQDAAIPDDHTRAAGPSQQTSTASGANIPMTARATNDAGPAVEVRLLDCRAVIVRTGMAQEVVRSRIADSTNVSGAGSTSAANTTNAGKKDATASAETSMAAVAEAWEKAKRRVGFEVEEFLRK